MQFLLARTTTTIPLLLLRSRFVQEGLVLHIHPINVLLYCYRPSLVVDVLLVLADLLANSVWPLAEFHGHPQKELSENSQLFFGSE